MSEHAHHHRHDAAHIGCAVLTVSDSRTVETDGSGRRIRELLEAQGHRVEAYVVIEDDPDAIRAALAGLPAAATAVVVNGGTGLTRRDTTYEAVRDLLDKEIPGFGELFRMLSFADIGAAAMLSRATAGISGARVVFVLPGSTAAVELAMTRLILPSLGHIAGLLRH